MSKIIAILQARVSSSRLPGKVLMPILGKPMLLRQIEREKFIPSIDRLIVATSTESSDDPLAEILEKNDIEVYRGSLDDVLDRYYQAARKYSPEHVVRLTGDCPLADPDIIEKVILKHIETGADYTSNVFPETYPDGLDVEVIRFSALKKAWENAELPSEREHVTPYIRNHTELFKKSNVECEQDLSTMRWTVDEPEDFKFVEQVYKALYKENKIFNMNDVLAYLSDNPVLMNMNDHIQRNEGALKSYEADREFLSEKKS